MASLREFLNAISGADQYLSLTCGISIVDPLAPVNNTRSWEIWATNEIGKFVYSGLRVFYEIADSICYLTQIVWRDIGGHSYRDP